jgi:hypothetical protein
MNNYIDLPEEGGGLGVTSLNGLTGALTLVAGSGITITPSGSSLTIAATNAGAVTAVTASSPLFSSGGTTPNITIQQATTSEDGYLSAADWNTFNNKQPAGSYITALTGDVTASGPGSAVASLTATTNSTLVTLSALSLPFSQVTGTVPISQGGTGQTTAPNAINALLPSQTGNSGDFLTTNGTVASWGPGNAGTVTSVALSVPGIIYSVSGSPVTSSGTLTLNALVQNANTVLAGPTSGAAAVPSFRSLVGTDFTGSFTSGSVIFAGSTGALSQDNSNFYWNDTTFNLGLGVIPATNAAMDIVNTSLASKAIQTTGYGVGSTIPFRGRFARGTSGTPAAAQAGDNLSVLSGRGYGTSQFAAASTGILNIVAGETFTNTSNATYLQFEVTPTGSVTAAEAMRVNSTGNVLIGTTTDSGTQKLQVVGNSAVGTVTSGIWQGSVPAVLYSTIPTQAVAALNIDWSTGNLFTKTLAANSTFTFSNLLSGQTIVVRLTNTASNFTVTWPTVKWPNQTAPTMTTGAFSDVYTFVYDGVNVYGSFVQNF